MSINVACGPEMLVLSWPDGRQGHYPHIWLRDNDPAGFHPETGERAFDLTSVALEITPQDVRVQGDALLLRWPGAEHDSRIMLDWLWAHRPGQRRADAAAITPRPWRADLGAHGVPRAQAEALASDPGALLAWLTETRRYGLSLVTGLADTPEASQALGTRIAHLRETNFGRVFEVKSKPNPNNLAYTADALPLHTDLPNQELPPGYQFLHCLANEAEGGGSVFCDGVAVANDLRSRDPAAFELLATTPVPFRFQDEDTDLRARKPVIVLGADGTVSEICLNAHIADIIDLPPESVPGFYRAYRQLLMLTRDPAYAVTLRLAAGQMVVFDNRRVLHGRAAFDPGTGYRHLHGFYVDRGDWDSRIRVLARQQAEG